MNRKGYGWTTLMSKAFWENLRREPVYHGHYVTRDYATQDISEYIEVFYARERRHSTLSYHSPVEYDARTDVA